MADTISVGLALALIATVKPPGGLDVYALRRQCRYRGIRSWEGRSISRLRREQLLTVLERHGGPADA